MIESHNIRICGQITYSYLIAPASTSEKKFNI